jgi:hypothetical protein
MQLLPPLMQDLLRFCYETHKTVFPTKNRSWFGLGFGAVVRGIKTSTKSPL